MSQDAAVGLRELVVDHIHTTLEDEDWQSQPPLRGALRGLTAAEAALKPAPPRHSIWQAESRGRVWLFLVARGRI